MECHRRNGRFWLILDEINRCDIDRVLGPVFTTLQDGVLRLPTLAKQRDIRVPSSFRVIATMNSADRNSLFPLSVALLRRFAFIDVPPIQDLNVEKQMLLAGLTRFTRQFPPPVAQDLQRAVDDNVFERFLDELLEFFHSVREAASNPDRGLIPELCVGSATVLEIAKYALAAQHLNPSTSVPDSIIDDALHSIYVPQLEGIVYSYGDLVMALLHDAPWTLQRSQATIASWRARAARHA
jgi:MoxR-like ATPase